MAKNRVLKSINSDGADRCVDVFVRADGTYGFEEYRRDAEDGRGWFPVGFYDGLVFDSEKAVLAEARLRVCWLEGQWASYPHPRHPGESRDPGRCRAAALVVRDDG
ncbi:MAG: hypothetical protein OER56_08585 [Hyphomicrobiales bacterium]|nr:hypothetical protein [Hyphomicrobiales bacterium]